MDRDFDVLVNRTEGAAVIELVGDVDLYNAPQLQEAIRELLASGQHRILVDLSRVEYIDSSGLGTLVGGLRRAREQDGDLSIMDASPRVRKVLSVTGLHRVFDLPDCDDAADGTP